MRTIIDRQGQAWDVMLGRESYGMQVLLFVPRGGQGVRKAMLAAETRVDAEAELDALDEPGLQERFARSVPWEAESLVPK